MTAGGRTRRQHLRAIARATRGVIGARVRELRCARLGHTFDDTVPSPPGRRFCSTCCERVDVDEDGRPR